MQAALRRPVHDRHERRGGPCKQAAVSSFLAIFVALLAAGYYGLLILQANVGLAATSRGVTVPLRLLMLALLAGIFFLQPVVRWTRSHTLLSAFAAVYGARIAVEVGKSSSFHLPPEEILFYFAGFAILPFFTISNLRLRTADFYRILRILTLSLLASAALVLQFYGQWIGEVDRLSLAVTREDNYISPLALSYAGALGIGIAFACLATGTAAKRWHLLALLLISLVPFFLGASRGSVVALTSSVLLVLVAQRRLRGALKTLAVAAPASLALVFATNLFGTGVFDRILRLSSDVEAGASSAIRLRIWEATVAQFWESPLVGDSLETEQFSSYPHNIVLESLVSTGLAGTIPLVALLASGLVLAFRLPARAPTLSWISVFYVQSLTQAMFSGALYSAGNVFCSLALLLVAHRALRADPRPSSAARPARLRRPLYES